MAVPRFRVPGSSGGGGGGGTPRPGRVRIERRAFVDGAGPYNALGATFFAGLWLYKHDRALLDHELAALRRAGVDYLRILCCVGFNGIPEPGHANSDSWGDRTIGPLWPDFPDVLKGFLPYVYAQGFRTQLTINGEDRRLLEQWVSPMDTREKRATFARTCCDIAAMHPEMVQSIEPINEGTDQGWELEECRDLATLIKGYGFVTSVTSPHDSAELDALYGGLGCQAATMHYERSHSGDGGDWEWVWKPYEYPWDAHQAPEAALDNEPENAGQQGGDNDPWRLAMSVWTAFVCQNAGHVFHATPLVRTGGKWDLDRGVPTHVDEIAGGDGVRYWLQLEAAFAACKRLLPPGVANFDLHNGQWASNPVDWVMGKPHNGPFEDGSVFKIPASIGPGGEIVIIALNVTRDVEGRARQSMALTEHDLFSGAALRTLDVNAGEILTLAGSRPGAVFTGRLR